MRSWLFETLAVTVERVDFLDPALAGQPDARERGVRVEVRPVRTVRGGSIYASATATVEPAVCRIDLLESRPGAADMMHWHPAMIHGEPGERTFDPAIPADPLGWLEGRLSSVEALLGATPQTAPAGLAAGVGEILRAVREGLEWARQPWPEVERDERGMAVES